MTGGAIEGPALWAVVLAVGTPLLSFGVIMVALRQRGRGHLAAGLSIAAVSVTLLAAIYLLISHWHMSQPKMFTVNWMVSGSLHLPYGFYLDPLALLMLAVVALICFLVQIYSIGYMAGDPGFGRYYGYMSLFAWAMTNLCVASGMFQLYVFWELVGLSSYLLIGFWFEKFSASQAGKKAFVMTRLGDVAFLLGLLLVLFQLGNLDIVQLDDPTVAAVMPPHLLTLSAVLIFGGIVGKSAQFPLLTWLPDAMEGPTPVSALLHSATMVAAGVFLFARLFPFFSHSAAAMTLFLAIGTISMLMAASMALVSRDIKQVWAFSTISQLGYMVMGLSAGGYVAGVFHLTTHAGFKALLFLCSGVFIHHYGTNDMFEIGARGGRQMKIAMACMLIGAAALAGVPPLSGFFSKEAIFAVLAGLDNPLWLTAGLLGGLLTAYYSFRLIFVILLPGSPGEAPAGEHHHPPPAVSAWFMEAPLLILAGATLLLGFTHHRLAEFVLQWFPMAVGEHAAPPWVVGTALALAAAGVGLAFWDFGRPGAARIGCLSGLPSLVRFLDQRWYLDRLYRYLLERIVYNGVSRICTANDKKVIDGTTDGMARGTLQAGRLLASGHLGMLQYRLMVMFVVVVLMALYFFLS
jgi:NADH-quinone oxidoreductase subunit L